MIGILPEPLPCELLYGIVARYARCLYSVDTASPSASGWLGFTRASQHGVCGMPHIVRLANAEPEVAIAHLWHEHSLMPFATAMMSQGRREAIYGSMCRSEKRNPESLATILLIPIGARKSTVGLRWCPECAAIDKSEFGRAYWHRVHHLPGSVICLRHKCWLIATNGTVSGALYSGPDDVPASEWRPRLLGEIPPLVTATAQLEEELLLCGAGLDIDQLRAALVFEIVRRSDARRRPGYPEGWRAIPKEELSRACDTWWDSGATSYWTLRPSILVRTIFALGRRDVLTVRVLAAMAFLGVTFARVRSMDWRAILAAELADRGVSPLSSRGDALQQELSAEEREERRARIMRDHLRRYPEKANQKVLSWRQLNPERARAMSRAWREKNPEKVQASKRRWREKNPEKVQASKRRWREKNPEKARAYLRRWRQENPEKVRVHRLREADRNRAKKGEQ